MYTAARWASCMTVVVWLDSAGCVRVHGERNAFGVGAMQEQRQLCQRLDDGLAGSLHVRLCHWLSWTVLRTRSDHFYSAADRAENCDERVCLCVCVCFSYLRNYTFDLHQFLRMLPTAVTRAGFKCVGRIIIRGPYPPSVGGVAQW